MRRYRALWLLSAAAITFLVTLTPTIWKSLFLDRSQQSSWNGVSQIEQGAEFVRTIVIEPGDYRRSIVGAVQPEWVGLTAAEFIERYPDWDLVSFSSERVIVEEWCKQVPPGGFVRREGDAIVIFDGDPAGCHRRRETVDIVPGEILRVAELEAGISFSDSLELELILEGLHGP